MRWGSLKLAGAMTMRGCVFQPRGFCPILDRESNSPACDYCVKLRLSNSLNVCGVPRSSTQTIGDCFDPHSAVAQHPFECHATATKARRIGLSHLRSSTSTQVSKHPKRTQLRFRSENDQEKRRNLSLHIRLCLRYGCHKYQSHATTDKEEISTAQHNLLYGVVVAVAKPSTSASAKGT